ncbi:hypothetical protein MUCCIDRAFT_113937 [Mucor lusitanicus CBS 277.49]|uniref:Uncharacterized protein n=1 Tax=Mucor lusitanicus CBS 277.49 TaxID=747725 RepID=A0A168IWR5_MUCCL|nr:hypothetical protein MUCCIDRAFT_113937 [Mucor lusitanicus CBS 277.49]
MDSNIQVQPEDKPNSLLPVTRKRQLSNGGDAHPRTSRRKTIGTNAEESGQDKESNNAEEKERQNMALQLSGQVRNQALSIDRSSRKAYQRNYYLARRLERGTAPRGRGRPRGRGTLGAGLPRGSETRSATEIARGTSRVRPRGRPRGSTTGRGQTRSQEEISRGVKAEETGDEAPRV